MNGRPFEQKICAVTGANGFIGSHLVTSLRAQGATVRALVRPTSDLSLLSGHEDSLVHGDVMDRDSLAAAFDGVEVVFHVAGIVKALSAETFQRVNGLGTQNVVEAASAAAPSLERLVHVSTIAVAGPSTPGFPRTEADAPAPISLYGHSKLAGELAVLKAADKLPVSIIRPTIVYGPGDTSTLELYRALKRHIKVVISGGPRFYNYIFVTDLVEALLLAAVNQKAIGEVFFIGHPKPASYDELQEQVLKAMDTWAVPVIIPASLLPMTGKVADWISKKRKKASIFGLSKAQEALPMQWLCSSQKAAELLGFTASTALELGLSIQTDWYRQQDLI